MFKPEFSQMKQDYESKKMIKRPNSVAKFSEDMTERFYRGKDRDQMYPTGDQLTNKTDRRDCLDN